MGNKVFANGMEISCKAGSGKAICAFPDVCFTPPQTPATPPGVPIPYPNTGMASDTTDGSKKVKISGKEVTLKNKSYFKKSTGDEAGATPKKGLITSTNRGKVYFNAWSMDVKFEGENVVRHLDLTTHNHNPAVGATPPWPYTDSASIVNIDSCKDDREAIKTACDGKEKCPGVLNQTVTEQRAQVTRTDEQSRTSIAGEKATQQADSSDCVQKSRCYLRPYEPNSKEDGCCPGQTPHHIPPKACLEGVKNYSMGKALCVCMEGANQHTGSHGKNHAAIEHLASKKKLKVGGDCNLGEYNKMCAMTVEAQCGCNAKCIEEQLNEDFKKKGIDPQKTNIKHVTTNSSAPLGKLQAVLDKAFEAAKKVASSRS